MSGHVGSQDAPDHTLPDLLEGLAAEALEDVAVVVLQNPERHAAVMVFKRRNVVVSKCEFGFRVYLVDVVITWMIQIMTDAGC